MATLNTETTATQASESKKPTHFVNVSVLTSAGKPIKLGYFPIFPDSADKAVRTLLGMFEKDPEAVKSLDIQIDMRKNEKSTDTYDADEWNMVTREVVAE